MFFCSLNYYLFFFFYSKGRRGDKIRPAQFVALNLVNSHLAAHVEEMDDVIKITRHLQPIGVFDHFPEQIHQSSSSKSSARPPGALPWLFAANVSTDCRNQHGQVLQRHHNPNGRILRHGKGPRRFRQLSLHFHRHLLGGKGRTTSADARFATGRRLVSGIHDCRFKRLLRRGVLSQQDGPLQFGCVSPFTFL